MTIPLTLEGECKNRNDPSLANACLRPPTVVVKGVVSVVVKGVVKGVVEGVVKEVVVLRLDSAMALGRRTVPA